MVHFIILNLLDRGGVLIWNRFRGRFSWKLWRANLNIIIINGMVITSTHDRWNHRAGFGRRGTGFEVSFWILAVSLSWWLIWFFTMKGVELIHLYSTTQWEEFRATDDSGTSLVSNPSTEFKHSLLYHAKSCNIWLEICCIIVDGIRRKKIMIALTWSVQFFGAPTISR